jgi:glutamate dehydrogenase/leucine dehydrogenase
MSARNEDLVVLETRCPGHEQVLKVRDEQSGLRTIIAIHSTALGPALGGTRFFPYPDEDTALADVVRLAEGMSLKSAAAGLRLGGGKAVIIGDPALAKSVELLEAYGRVVESLDGRYITAEDVGTTVEDMVSVRTQTRWVTGLPLESGGSGDPSPWTARGVVAAMKAVSAHLWDTTELSGRRVAVQGVGKVGASLVRLLCAEHCEVTVADVDAAAVEQLAADAEVLVVPPRQILSTPCEFFAPCALGSVIDDASLAELRCAAVVGSANNQLAHGLSPETLAEAGVLYAPDFVVNAGGVINISAELELEGYRTDRAEAAVDRIFDTVTQVLQAASARAQTPLEAAIDLAQGRIHQAAPLVASD